MIKLRGAPDTGAIQIWTGHNWQHAVTKDGRAYDVLTRLWIGGNGGHHFFSARRFGLADDIIYSVQTLRKETDHDEVPSDMRR